MQNEFGDAFQQFASMGMTLNFAPPQPAYHTHTHTGPLASTSQPVYQPQPQAHQAPSPSELVQRRRRGGSRRISPEDLLPLDAPTQPRRYTATSSPGSSSAASMPPLYRRQSYAKVSDEEEDELAEEPPAPDASECEKAQWKRRQNTLAARRSRKRKMLQLVQLEKQVEELTKEKEIWKTRALTLKQMLISHGILNVNFKDEE